MKEIKRFKEQVKQLRTAEERLDAAETDVNAVIREMASSVRAWREVSGIGLRSLARTLGVSVTYLCDIEHGRRPLLNHMINRFLKQMEATCQRN